jgi:hypothetical protein
MRIRRSKEEVATILEEFIEGRGGKWNWDDFVFVDIDDPELDRIRERCDLLSHEFPPDAPGQYCSDRGVEVIRNFIAELRK